MRVMIVNNVYPPIMAGGAELIVRYLAEDLAARDNEVSVLSTCGPEMEPYPREVANGVEVTRFFPKNLYWSWTRKGATRSALDTVRWHIKDAWNRDAGRRVGEELDRVRPDVIHTHLIDGFSATVWAEAKKRGVKVVHTAHDYHLVCPRSLLLSKDGERICETRSLPCQAYGSWHSTTLKHLDVFCSPSQFLIDKHLDFTTLPEDRRVVRNGVPLPQGVAARAADSGQRNSERPLEVIYLARLTPEKGVDVVIDAMRSLSPDAPIRLKIAGKGPLEDKVKALAAEDPRVEFLGFVAGEEKHELFSKADALLMPSLWYENAPVVITEAHAYGLGVIGSDLGAIPEFVTHDQTGLLFTPGEGQALAAALSRAAREPELLAKFRENGPARAAALSVGAMSEAYLEVYQ